MKYIKPAIVSIAVVASLAVIISLVYASRQIFGDVRITQEQAKFEITEGESVKQVTAALEKRGIVKSDFWFRTYVWLTGSEKKFIAGTFDLPEKMNTVALIRLLTTSAKRETKSIKILEGWGIRDIGVYLENLGMFRQEDLAGLIGREHLEDSLNAEFYLKQAEQYPVLLTKRAKKPAEGYLFPDTYEVYANATIEDVVGKMFANFDRKVTPELREEIEQQGKDFYDVLIMASIIEAEVSHDEDRAVVSDIFWSRLASGVPLQSDATLNYAIDGTSPSLTFDQLKIDSPYNTYLYRGLPPTPIGNPGIASIRAAIYPADTDYFYFLSTPEGETVFSRTLEEHNAAKVKHLR